MPLCSWRLGLHGCLWNDWEASRNAAESSSFGVGVKMDHVSLPSLPPTPWDPGVRPLRVDGLIFSSISGSQALLFFGFASFGPGPEGVS